MPWNFRKKNPDWFECQLETKIKQRLLNPSAPPKPVVADQRGLPQPHATLDDNHRPSVIQYLLQQDLAVSTKAMAVTQQTAPTSHLDEWEDVEEDWEGEDEDDCELEVIEGQIPSPGREYDTQFTPAEIGCRPPRFKAAVHQQLLNLHHPISNTQTSTFIQQTQQVEKLLYDRYDRIRDPDRVCRKMIDDQRNLQRKKNLNP